MIIKKIIKKFIPKSRFEKTVAKFKEDNKKHGLMLNYDLNENSLVFDVGGYKGQGASDIFSMYLPTIYIFEPRAEYAQAMEKRFKKWVKPLIKDGELTKYIELLETNFTLNPKGDTGVNFLLKLPDKLEPGTHTGYVKIKESMPEELRC